MAMKQVNPSVLSTNSLLDVLSSDHSDEELLSAASESWYNDVSKTAHTLHLLPVYPADWQLLQMTWKGFICLPFGL